MIWEWTEKTKKSGFVCALAYEMRMYAHVRSGPHMRHGTSGRPAGRRPWAVVMLIKSQAKVSCSAFHSLVYTGFKDQRFEDSNCPSTRPLLASLRARQSLKHSNSTDSTGYVAQVPAYCA